MNVAMHVRVYVRVRVSVRVFVRVRFCTRCVCVRLVRGQIL